MECTCNNSIYRGTCAECESFMRESWEDELELEGEIILAEIEVALGVTIH